MSDNFTDFQAMAEVVKFFRQVSKESREYLMAKLQEEHTLLGDGDIFGDIKAQYIAGGRSRKIEAIKEVRDRSININVPSQFRGLGLKEAKDLVETW